VKQGFNPGIRKSWKSTCLIQLDVRSHCCIYFTKEWRAEAQILVYDLTISNPGFKLVSSNASFGWTVRFWRHDRGFLQEGLKTYLMAPMSPLNSLNVFLSSHLWNMLFTRLLIFARLSFDSLSLHSLGNFFAVLSCSLVFYRISWCSALCQKEEKKKHEELCPWPAGDMLVVLDVLMPARSACVRRGDDDGGRGEGAAQDCPWWLGLLLFHRDSLRQCTRWTVPV
jgi:hypothetical protein